MARQSILTILAQAEADLATQVADWINERDVAWRAILRTWLRDDIAALRALRQEAEATPFATFEMDL
jgi:hypothetical protein